MSVVLTSGLLTTFLGPKEDVLIGGAIGLGLLALTGREFLIDLYDKKFKDNKENYVIKDDKDIKFLEKLVEDLIVIKKSNIDFIQKSLNESKEEVPFDLQIKFLVDECKSFFDINAIAKMQGYLESTNFFNKNQSIYNETELYEKRLELNNDREMVFDYIKKYLDELSEELSNSIIDPNSYNEIIKSSKDDLITKEIDIDR